MTGIPISHLRILKRIGEGGMGVTSSADGASERRSTSIAVFSNCIPVTSWRTSGSATPSSSKASTTGG